jgi:hypothetical protein
LIVCSSLGLEASSGGFLSNSDTVANQAVGFLLVHITACIMLAVALARLLSTRYHRTSAGGLIIVLFSLSFFIPWAGALGLLCVLVPALIWREKVPVQQRSSWCNLTIPSLPLHPPDSHGNVGTIGEARIAGILHGNTNLNERQRAVLSTLRLRDEQAIPLLRQALKDSEDDVRLLAYALMDRKEQAITARLRLRQQQLDKLRPDQRVGLHKLIAYDCWELIHLGLAQGEVLRYLLMTARTNVEDALKLNPKNANLQFLLGKILLRQGELVLASTAFRQAEELGIDSIKINPYLAEISFSQRRFANVSAYLANMEALVSSPMLQTPVTYWQSHA